MLLFLAGFTWNSFARGEDDLYEHHQLWIYHSEDENDDDHIRKTSQESRSKNLERLNTLREKNKKRIKTLRKKYEDASSKSSSWSTQTGSTQASGGKKEVPSTPVATSSSPVTHTATVKYNTPEGSVSVGFSVTVKSGIVTAASSTKKAWWTSGYYQDSFATSISAGVVGKKIAWLNLSAIGWASLTTNAFEKFIVANF